MAQTDKIYYKKEIQVAYYECTVDRRIKLSSVMRHIQQVSSEHLEKKYIPAEEMLSAGQGFLLSKMELHLERLPQVNEHLRIETVPLKPKGAQFPRNVTFYDESGVPVIVCKTAWLLVDMADHKILRPSAFAGELVYGEEENQVAAFRIKAPALLQSMGERVIRFSDLDSNGHLNNAVYADILYDCFGESLIRNGIRRFYINFQKEALLGDVLLLSSAAMENGEVYFQGSTRAAVSFEVLFS